MTIEPSDTLMVGGEFNNICGLSSSYLARIDVNGTLINSFATTTLGSGYIFALGQQGYNRVMVGTDNNNYIYNIYSGYDVFLTVKDNTFSASTTLNYMPIEIRNYS